MPMSQLGNVAGVLSQILKMIARYKYKSD